MAEALRALGVKFTALDVDADPALVERFGNRVPVLTDDADREICHARLDPAALHARGFALE